jgi:pimeloyl-ACP methyl ester carboxylesterase
MVKGGRVAKPASSLILLINCNQGDDDMVSGELKYRVEDISIQTGDGLKLKGSLFTQAEPGQPVIVLSHGFGAVRNMLLDVVARNFAEAGLNCVAYDHRCLGESEGTPRNHIDPWLQISDTRDVVTYARNLPGVAGERLGLWGTSYSGGHALVVAATDRRVRAVVTQGPTISGRRNALRRFPGDMYAQFEKQFAADRDAVFNGAEPAIVAQVPDFTEEDRLHDEQIPEGTPFGNSTRAWIRAIPPGASKGWDNALTLRSYELYRGYEPGNFIAQISPTPLLLITGDSDSVTPTDEILKAYAEAREPKRLKIVPGGHYDLYGSQRAVVTQAAADFYLEML